MSIRIRRAANFIKRHMVPQAKAWAGIVKSWRLNHPVHILVTLPGLPFISSMAVSNPTIIGVANVAPGKWLVSALAAGTCQLNVTIQLPPLSFQQTIDITVVP